MNWQQYFHSEKTQKILLIGIVLLLLAAITGVSIMLQMQFNARLNQIEKATLVNNQRVTNIVNFLNQAAQNTQANQTAPATDTTKSQK
ncbi:MAG: hypothetical protein V1765_02085 [bacterium]